MQDDVGPLFKLDIASTGIHRSKPILVRDIVSSTVQAPRVVIGIVDTRTVDQNMLYISPTQVGVGLEHQGNHTACQRRGR